MKLWKVLGLAGLAGVAATGVIIAREQRQRAQLTPEEVRARLQERLQNAPAPGGSTPEPTGTGEAAGPAVRSGMQSPAGRGCLPLHRFRSRRQPASLA